MHYWEPKIANRIWRGAKVLVVAACCVSQIGCVQRRFTIRSNPPGALVYVDNREIGTTPISHDFIYYGTREIRLIKDGYETLTVLTPFTTPWYEIPGIDFVSENLVPGEIRDHRVLDFQLTPQVIVPTEQLMGRAEELRRTRNSQATAPPALPGAAPQAFPQTQRGVVLPPPPGAPLVVPPGNVNTVPPGNFSANPPSGILPPPPARAIPQPPAAAPLSPGLGGSVPPPSSF